eukprot:TRINITY_DN77039_c0_g1_i1.p1 TRINITY_DN77039_c0_g1~~TRINITY_DN77039_c0_g1_i1.p1  ORF type:complete len:1382 (-),score=243.87 TRINITY_DN77039_c0_g1_i1:209-4354(-)
MTSISWLHMAGGWLALLMTWGAPSLGRVAATSQQQQSLQTTAQALMRTEARGEVSVDEASHSFNAGGKMHTAVDNVGNVNSLALTQQTPLGDVDCVWEEWHDWSPCQFTCGGGEAMRTRKVKTMAEGNGAACDNNLKETRACTNNDCPVDCSWDEWGDWTACSTSCGPGTKAKSRNFKQAAAFGGLTCPGSTTQSTECTLGECPVDCKYGSWENWGGCSVSCGGGSRKRFRPVAVSPNTVGKQCESVGKNVEEAVCGQNNCPVDCELEDWTSWDLCDVSCGQGFTKRTRAIKGSGPSFGGQPCGAMFQNKTCDNGQCPADCKLSDWSDWHACDVTCGAGKRKRSRVVAEAGNVLGAKCATDEASRLQTESCNMNGCPIDCKMGDWTQWTDCSVSCSAGINERYRENQVHAEYGGRACHYNTTYEKRYCSSEACPVDCEWDDWQEWRGCSTTCGNGSSLRLRIVKTPVANGGKTCPGDYSQTRECNLRFCPVHCQWNDWADWSSCSNTCGEGNQGRTRKVGVEADFGGLACTGNTQQSRSCSDKPCPVHCAWKDWSEWTTCSSSCGQGQHSRTRSIGTQPNYGGEPCKDSAAETKDCANLPVCPVDCEWDAWTDWQDCSKSCGEGVSKRTRIRKQYEKGGGHVCWGTDQDQQACKPDPCPIDCALGDWSHWGSCSKTCGDDGVHLRTRGIKSTAKFGGKECDAPRNATKSCELGPCPVDCVWTDWEPWSYCSKSCNGGVTSRKRSVKSVATHNGRPCEGSTMEDGACNVEGCPLDCKWDPWSDWGTCGATCGGGVRRQTRAVKIMPANGGMACDTTNDQGGPANEKNESCNEDPCPLDCAWSSWSAFSPCSKSCGAGNMSRTRVKQPAEEYGGVPCVGESLDTNFCNTQGCPRDCKWGDWSQWTECSKKCGGGKIKRFRDIAVTRKDGGEKCTGPFDQESDCNMNECPVNCQWGDWADWSACPASCGSAMRSKTRPKKREERSGGEPCDGNATAMERCTFVPCPVDCELKPWSDWSACSAPCGGERFRSRVKAMEMHAGKPCDGEMGEKAPCNREGSQGCPTTTTTKPIKPCNKSYPDNQTQQIDTAINSLKLAAEASSAGALSNVTSPAAIPTVASTSTQASAAVPTAISTPTQAPAAVPTAASTATEAGDKKKDVVSEVAGDLALDVADGDRFVSGSDTARAMKEVISSIAQVPDDLVRVYPTLNKAVLLATWQRRATGNVNVAYIIEVTRDSGKVATDVAERLSKLQINQVTDLVQKSLNANKTTAMTASAMSLTVTVLPVENSEDIYEAAALMEHDEAGHEEQKPLKRHDASVPQKDEVQIAKKSEENFKDRREGVEEGGLLEGAGYVRKHDPTVRSAASSTFFPVLAAAVVATLVVL